MQIDPKNDWSSFSTEQLIRILKRDELADSRLDLCTGNQIVVEILERMNQQLGGK